MNIALKEWAAVIRALERGRQVVLLRKGGIAEVEGRFEVAHRRFLLYPTYEHQNEKMLVPEWRPLVRQTESERQPGRVTFTSWAQVEEVLRVGARDELDRLGLDHVFAPAYIEQRMAYKPELPLYVLILRVFALPNPVTVTETPAYEGCRSWVDLSEEISTAGSVAVLTDEEFARRIEHLPRPSSPEE